MWHFVVGLTLKWSFLLKSVFSNLRPFRKPLLTLFCTSLEENSCLEAKDPGVTRFKWKSFKEIRKNAWKPSSFLSKSSLTSSLLILKQFDHLTDLIFFSGNVLRGYPRLGNYRPWAGTDFTWKSLLNVWMNEGRRSKILQNSSQFFLPFLFLHFHYHRTRYFSKSFAL